MLVLLSLLAGLAYTSAASAETRTLKLYFTHTREKAEITYKRNGRYLQDGLNQINRFLRDWRRNESTKMDPRLLDLLWETYRATGARDHIHVVSAYRSPATNEMLRKRSRGVATKSQHMLGKAIDFYIPGVKLATLRRAGLSLHGGGVGYYPKSGSPFVHLDVGSVRHWPRMNRQELMAMFPDGKTLHVPSDGKPLPGYQQALAAYNKRAKSGGTIAVASAAEPQKKKKGGGLLAAFFRGGADREEDEAETGTAPARAAPQAVASAPAVAAEPEETPALMMASLPAEAVPLPMFAPRATAPAEADQSVAALLDAVQGNDLPAIPAAGPAAEVTAEAEAVDVAALNVPLPTPRPADMSGLAAIAAVMNDDATGLDEARSILNSSLLAAIPAQPGFVPQPAPRAGEQGLPPVVTALVPVEAPDALASGLNDAARTLSAETAGELSPEALRQHVIASLDAPGGSRPLDVAARTTSKAPRPAAEDARQRRKALIVPAPRHLTPRAFVRDPIADVIAETQAPSFSFSPNNTAPREVYTAGFSNETHAAQPNRFTGSAVTFLSIARFN